MLNLLSRVDKKIPGAPRATGLNLQFPIALNVVANRQNFVAKRLRITKETVFDDKADRWKNLGHQDGFIEPSAYIAKFGRSQ